MAYSDRDRVYAWLDAGNGEKLTTLDRAILVTIAERANSASGLFAPGIAEIAQRWGVHPESAGRSIARLHGLGLVDTAERGRGQHRARYTLTGEVAQPTGLATSPTETESSPTENPSSPTENPSSPTHGLGVLSESSRSSYGVRTTPKDDDALPRAPLTGARQRGQEHAMKNSPAHLVAYVTEALSMSTDQATEWMEERLNGHTVRNVDNYIRRCVENYSPPKPKHKPEASNGSKPAGSISTAPRCCVCNRLLTADDAGWKHPVTGDRWCDTCAPPAGIRTLENIAAILGVQPVPCQDDDDGNQQIELTRAGLALGVYTNLPTQRITIYSEHNSDDMTKPSPWSELPDEPFRNRAYPQVDADLPLWDYRPHDAVYLIERWHEATSNVGAKPQVWQAIEKIASILDVATSRYSDDDEDELTAEAQQAGLNFVAYASLMDKTVTVSCEFADGDESWPEGKPLPDERFHDRAISGDDLGRKYYPADAVTIAEHWHDQTRAIAKEIPA